uniref:Ig-like domain-containing protein n=1 Tax=Schizaphis graminum TaxID=13262 RepID=A0A2S2NBE5_SCHGA
MVVVSTPDATTPKSVPWRSLHLSDGFFGHYRSQPHTATVKKPAARRRVTERPKNATGDNGESSTAVAAAAPILFATEDECESANPGRACVCRMTDLLDLVVQRLDEAMMSAADDQEGGGETAALKCRSFKTVPAAFVIYPATAAADGDDRTIAPATDVPVDVVVERNGGKTGGRPIRDGSGVNAVEDAVKEAPTWKQINFNDVLNYQLERSSTDDHYAVQYGLVGSDAKVQCVINGNGTKMNSFKWDFKQGKHKTNSTVTGTDSNILLILAMEPGDSKNYTCMPKTDVVGDSKNGSSYKQYKHYVIAVEKAIYEIRGSAIYKTRDGGGCTHELIVRVQKQLSSSMRSVLCPEGSSRYACNVIVENPKCAEDKRTIEIKYLITLNDNSTYLARIRTNKKGQIALRYQKLLAKISSVLASNLNKTMTVPIMSKLSLIETNFAPDHTSTNNFVSCSPGFGIREVFCAACPPQHYSPDKSIKCLKCAKGFHQPVAGSDKCVKCTNIFTTGCYMNEVSPTVYYVIYLIIILVVFLVLLFMACFCAFYGREEKEKSINMIPRKFRKRFKKKKKYSLLSQMENTTDNSSIISKNYGKLKNLLKLKKKSKLEIINPKITFNNVHEKFGQQIQNNHVTEDSSTATNSNF